MNYVFRLKQRRLVAEATLELVFATAEPYEFTAGQNAELTLLRPLYTDAQGEMRVMSLASRPGGRLVRIVCRLTDSAYKRTLAEMAPGSEVTLSQAAGDFTLSPEETRPLVFIAGGVGIAPFLSLLPELANRSAKPSVRLFYLNRRPNQAAYLDELGELAGQLSFTVELFYDDDTARPFESQLPALITKPSEPVFYLAGPSGMISRYVNRLEKIGVPGEHIKTEDFTGY